VTVDLVGSILLVATALMLTWTVISVRNATAPRIGTTSRDLATAFGLVAASTITAAAGLLMTVPFAATLGRVTGDPGVAPDVQAGIAQAGSVVLFVAAIPLAVTVVLLARLGAGQGSVPRWVVVTAWVTAALLLLGASVGLLMPFAAWSIALGLTWRPAGELLRDA